jgi:hypothetical protein
MVVGLSPPVSRYGVSWSCSGPAYRPVASGVSER